MNYEKNTPSIGQWMLYILVAGIPVVGLIMLIVWMMDNTNVVRKNWAAAMLIWTVISFILIFLLWGTIFALLDGGMASDITSTL